MKNIKQHFKNFYSSSVSPTHQDLSNDTTFSQIKSRVPVPLSNVALQKNDKENIYGSVVKEKI